MDKEIKFYACASGSDIAYEISKTALEEWATFWKIHIGFLGADAYVSFPDFLKRRIVKEIEDIQKEA